VIASIFWSGMARRPYGSRLAKKRKPGGALGSPGFVYVSRIPDRG
jgi:hypothetical protein